MYKQYGVYDANNELIGVQKTSIQRVSDNACIPFDPANSDYQTFKAQINADETQLEDADGDLMAPADAKAFVETLP